MENNQKLIAQDIQGLQSIRAEGKKNFLLPTKKDEYWQYTNLDNLTSTKRQYANQQTTEYSKEFAGYCIYFDNGHFAPQKSNLPDGIEVLPLIEAVIMQKSNEYLNKIAASNAPFVNLNNSNLQEGVFIKVAKNINFKKPLAIINYSNQPNTWHALRNIIVIDANSSLELIEFVNSDADCFSNVVNEIFLYPSSKLTHYTVNKDVSCGVTNTFVNVKKDAHYLGFNLQKDAPLSRNEVQITLAEEGASADYNAIYKGENTSLQDNTIHIIHNSSNTISNQLVKGVVSGSSRGVYQGKISIGKGCDNVVGNQQHRAIILSDHASVDVKPELEIFNDDVKCSHGSAIGKLDEKAMFYLQSRGLSESAAKSLLIGAFLTEVAEKIQNLDIKKTFLLAI